MLFVQPVVIDVDAVAKLPLAAEVQAASQGEKVVPSWNGVRLAQAGSTPDMSGPGTGSATTPGIDTGPGGAGTGVPGTPPSDSTMPTPGTGGTTGTDTSIPGAGAPINNSASPFNSSGSGTGMGSGSGVTTPPPSSTRPADNALPSVPADNGSSRTR